MAQAIVGDILKFPDAVLFDRHINIGTSADVTSGNVKYDGVDFLARVGSVWKSMTRPNFVDLTVVESATAVTTTSITFQMVTGFTVTPVAGKYKVEITMGASMTGGTNAAGEFRLELNTTVVPNTLRTIAGTSPSDCVAITKIVDVNGTQAINLKFRTLSTTRPLIAGERTMIITRLN